MKHPNALQKPPACKWLDDNLLDLYLLDDNTSPITAFSMLQIVQMKGFKGTRGDLYKYIRAQFLDPSGEHYSSFAREFTQGKQIYFQGFYLKPGSRPAPHLSPLRSPRRLFASPGRSPRASSSVVGESSSGTHGTD